MEQSRHCALHPVGVATAFGSFRLYLLAWGARLVQCTRREGPPLCATPRLAPPLRSYDAATVSAYALVARRDQRFSSKWTNRYMLCTDDSKC